MIGPDRLDGRITLAGLPTEIVSMASAVNGALDRVARAYRARLAEQGAVDQLHLQRLKKRKLMLRDEIGWLESRLIPDNIA